MHALSLTHYLCIARSLTLSQQFYLSQFILIYFRRNARVWKMKFPPEQFSDTLILLITLATQLLRWPEQKQSNGIKASSSLPGASCQVPREVRNWVCLEDHSYFSELPPAGSYLGFAKVSLFDVQGSKGDAHDLFFLQMCKLETTRTVKGLNFILIDWKNYFFFALVGGGASPIFISLCI